MSSMPARTLAADQNDLKPSIGLVRVRRPAPCVRDRTEKTVVTDEMAAVFAHANLYLIEYFATLGFVFRQRYQTFIKKAFQLGQTTSDWSITRVS